MGGGIMSEQTVFQKWGRDISKSKREERGALDIVITKEPDVAFPDERVIDIVYHNTDVGVKFYLAHNVEQFFQVLDLAEEFCDGYRHAIDDMRSKENGD